MTEEKCIVCGKNKGIIEISEGRKICPTCEDSWKKAQMYESEKAAEAAETQKMIQEGLCNFCAKVDYCEMVKNPQIGKCKPNDRCTDFVDKKKLSKKERAHVKTTHGKVPIASEAGKPKNEKAIAPKEDVYSWVLGLDLNESEQEEVARFVESGLKDDEIKRKVTAMLLRRKKNGKT